MQRKLAAAALGLAVLVAGIAAAAPTVAAQVGDTVDFIIHIRDDGKAGGIEPGYLPPGFAERPIVIGLSQSGPGQAPQIGASRLYRDGERFVYIARQKPAGGDLPAGKRLTVGSSPAVLEENLSGSVPSGPAQPGASVPVASPIGATPLAGANPPAPMPVELQPLTYADARRLSWFIGSGATRTKVEILSNLPESEIVKIAEALKLH